MGKKQYKSILIELLAFYFPLAMTHLMMSGGTPVVNAGIARCPNPIEGLAAFAVAFSFSLFLHSLCFGLEPTSVALVKSPKSLKKVTLFAIYGGLIISLVEFLIGITPVSTLVFEFIFGLKPHIAKQAGWALVMFSPMPLLLALRSVGRGGLASASKTGLVGIGTFLRLAAMIIAVVIGVVLQVIPGAYMGALAFSVGVFTESMFVIFGVWKHKDKLPGEDKDAYGTSFSSIYKFVAPFLISVLIGVSAASFINIIISRGAEPKVSISAFSVVQSIVWFTTSMLLAFQQLVVARGRSEQEKKEVFRFATYVIVFLVVLQSLIAFTPIGEFIIRELIGVTGRTLDQALYAVLFIPLFPIVVGYRSYLRGVAVRDKKTKRTLVSSIVSVASGVIVGIFLLGFFEVGAMVAITIWIVLNLTEIIVLFGWKLLKD